jgi:pimeloyl-ACP methyl ester carboxylesterase
VTRVRTADGLTLAVDGYGDGQRAVVLLHGGGQTRHAWARTATALAAAGWSAYVPDLRGHGESDRALDGRYRLDDFVDDVAAVARCADPTPVLVGASLGGAAALLYAGERRGAAGALVLVDVGVRARDDGVARIVDFMRRHVDGFASLDDAAAAVAAYTPQRERAARPAGLAKNLRRDADGRYRWRWDPELLANFDVDSVARNARVEAALRAVAARRLPTTVVHGARSDVLDAETAAETARLAGATVTSVADAAHMVAGDANDAFSDALLRFLRSL